MLTFIIRLVGLIMLLIFLNSFINTRLLHGELIEWIWTLIPGLILLLIAIPSLKILYYSNNFISFRTEIKVIGNQWYWTYDYSYVTEDFPLRNEIESYIIPHSYLEDFEFRLLEVDNALKVPFNFSRKIIISSNDVLHSWTIPSMGLKVDAIPGRLNQLGLFPYQVGVYFGQCSEICGAKHRFIPIVIEVIELEDWLIFCNQFNLR